MSESTLDSLTRRIEVLEREVSALKSTSHIAPTRDWRSVVGISKMTDFSKTLLDEMTILKESDRIEAERVDTP